MALLPTAEDITKKKLTQKNNQLLRMPGALNDTAQTLQSIEKQREALPAQTPAEALAQGASPMAAAMAGTPANKARIRSDATKEASVVQAQAKAQTAKGGTVFDKAVNDLSNQVQTLGSFEAAVPAKQLEYLNKTLLPQAQPIQELYIDPNSDLAKQDPKLQKALTEGRSVSLLSDGSLHYGEPGTSTKQPITGMTGADYNTSSVAALQYNGVAPDTILPSFDEATGIGKHVAQALPDQATLQWAMNTSTPDEQAELNNIFEQWGVNPEASQAELQNIIRRKQTEFADIDRAQATLANTTATMEERANARQWLEAQGLAGKRAPAEKLNNIVAQIEDNDTVDVFGEQMTIADMLKDDFVQQQAMDALEDPAYMATLKADKNTLAFANYLENNRAAWNKLLEPVKASLTAHEAVAKQYKATASFGDGTAIADAIGADVMDKLYPDYDDIRKVGSPVPPLLSALNTVKDPTQIKAVGDFITQAKDNPEVWDVLKNMNVTELAQKGILSGKLDYVSMVTDKAAQNAMAGNLAGRSPQDASKVILGDNYRVINNSAEKIKQALSETGFDINSAATMGNNELASLPEDKQDLVITLRKILPVFNLSTMTLDPEVLAQYTTTSDIWNAKTPAAIDTQALLNNIELALNEATIIKNNKKAAAAQADTDKQLADKKAADDKMNALVAQLAKFVPGLTADTIYTWAAQNPKLLDMYLVQSGITPNNLTTTQQKVDALANAGFTPAANIPLSIDLSKAGKPSGFSVGSFGPNI